MAFIIILAIILALAIGFYLFLKRKSPQVGNISGGPVGKTDQFDPTTVIAAGPSSVGTPGPTTPPDLTPPTGSNPSQPGFLGGSAAQAPAQQPPANPSGPDNQGGVGPAA